MRQKCAKMGLVLLGKEEGSRMRLKMRQTCVKDASKMRGTPSGENTFWTIPMFSVGGKDPVWRKSVFVLPATLPHSLWLAEHLSPELIEFFSGRPRGGDNFTSLSKCSRPFIQSVKSTLSELKSCNPVRGTPSSTA